MGRQTGFSVAALARGSAGFAGALLTSQAKINSTTASFSSATRAALVCTETISLCNEYDDSEYDAERDVMETTTCDGRDDPSAHEQALIDADCTMLTAGKSFSSAAPSSHTSPRITETEYRGLSNRQQLYKRNSGTTCDDDSDVGSDDSDTVPGRRRVRTSAKWKELDSGDNAHKRRRSTNTSHSGCSGTTSYISTSGRERFVHRPARRPQRVLGSAAQPSSLGVSVPVVARSESVYVEDATEPTHVIVKFNPVMLEWKLQCVNLAACDLENASVRVFLVRADPIALSVATLLSQGIFIPFATVDTLGLSPISENDTRNPEPNISHGFVSVDPATGTVRVKVKIAALSSDPMIHEAFRVAVEIRIPAVSERQNIVANTAKVVTDECQCSGASTSANILINSQTDSKDMKSCNYERHESWNAPLPGLEVATVGLSEPLYVCSKRNRVETALRLLTKNHPESEHKRKRSPIVDDATVAKRYRGNARGLDQPAYSYIDQGNITCVPGTSRLSWAPALEPKLSSMFNDWSISSASDSMLANDSLVEMECLTTDSGAALLATFLQDDSAHKFESSGMPLPVSAHMLPAERTAIDIPPSPSSDVTSEQLNDTITFDWEHTLSSSVLDALCNGGRSPDSLLDVSEICGLDGSIGLDHPDSWLDETCSCMTRCPADSSTIVSASVPESIFQSLTPVDTVGTVHASAGNILDDAQQSPTNFRLPANEPVWHGQRLVVSNHRHFGQRPWDIGQSKSNLHRPGRRKQRLQCSDTRRVLHIEKEVDRYLDGMSWRFLVEDVR